MRLLLFVILTTSYSQAAFLAYKHKVNEDIIKKITRNPITLKRALLPSKKIKHTELGRRLTPFYYHNLGTYKAIYKNFEDKCLELTITKELIAKKIQCDYKVSYKLEAYPDFKHVSLNKLKKSKEFKKSWTINSYDKKLKGFSFYYFLKDIYLGEEKSPRLANFSFNLKEMITISNSKKNGFIVSKAVVFNRAPFHFYSPEKIINKVELKLKERDFLFVNDQGEMLLYKTYQPHPLDFRYLTIVNNFQDHLDGVEDNLYTHKNQKVCFLDYAFRNSPYDCKKNSLKSGNYLRYRKFDLLYINTSNETVERN